MIGLTSWSWHSKSKLPRDYLLTLPYLSAVYLYRLIIIYLISRHEVLSLQISTAACQLVVLQRFLRTGESPEKNGEHMPIA